jgi:hypothetical protein
MESGLFFVCCCLSYFLSTAGGHEVGKSWERCQAIIFISIFLIVLKKKMNPAVPFFMFPALVTENIMLQQTGLPLR